MHIIVNGSSTEVPADLSMAALVERMALTGQRIAVEVNAELVPRGRFQEHQLSDGDRVEIIHAVGGG